MVDLEKQPTKEQIKEFWEWVLGNEAYVTDVLNGKQCIYKRILTEA